MSRLICFSDTRRSPHGGRGLKFEGDGGRLAGYHRSIPTQTEWIEVDRRLPGEDRLRVFVEESAAQKIPQGPDL